MTSRTHAFCAVLVLGLIGCYEEGPRVCPNGPDEATADTFIGARVDGRAVMTTKGSPGSSVTFLLPESEHGLMIIGRTRDDSPPQYFQLNFNGFHGVGSYPIGNFYQPGTAFAAYGCQYYGQDIPFEDAGFAYWPQELGMAGDTAWVTAWDSLGGRLRGKFAFHGTDSEGGLVPITDGTFDVIVRK